MKQITNIRVMSPDSLREYINMTPEEALLDYQKYVDLGKVVEDTVVFPIGKDINVDNSASRRLRMLGPDLSFNSHMPWNKIDPHMMKNIANGKKRAETVIENIKNKKTYKFNFKKLIKNILKKKETI